MHAKHLLRVIGKNSTNKSTSTGAQATNLRKNNKKKQLEREWGAKNK